MNVIKHLQEPDAALVALAGEPEHHLPILLHHLRGNLRRLGIIRQFDQRGERVPVPEVKGVHPVFQQEIQIAGPLRLVVEKRKVLRRVGPEIIPPLAGLQALHTDAGPAHLELRPVGQFQRLRQQSRFPHAPRQFLATVEKTRIVAAPDRQDPVTLPGDGKMLGFERGIETQRYSGFPRSPSTDGDLTPLFLTSGFEQFDSELKSRAVPLPETPPDATENNSR